MPLQTALRICERNTGCTGTHLVSRSIHNFYDPSSHSDAHWYYDCGYRHAPHMLITKQDGSMWTVASRKDVCLLYFTEQVKETQEQLFHKNPVSSNHRSIKRVAHFSLWHMNPKFIIKLLSQQHRFQRNLGDAFTSNIDESAKVGGGDKTLINQAKRQIVTHTTFTQRWKMTCSSL